LQIEFNRFVLLYVFFVGGLQPLEPGTVIVEDRETMSHLCQPEVEIGNLSAQLMPVQSREFSDLTGQYVRNVHGIRHSVTL